MPKRVKEFHSIMPVSKVASILVSVILSQNYYKKLAYHANKQPKAFKKVGFLLNLFDFKEKVTIMVT